MEQIDWRHQPEHATHALRLGDRIEYVWAKYPDGGGHASFHALDDRQAKTTDYYMARSGWEIVSCRSTFPAMHSIPHWNGGGLPPVGAECLLSDSHVAGVLVKILAHDGCLAVFCRDGEYFGRTAKDFKHIRTEEQIAAETEKERKQKWCRDTLLECGHLHPSLELSLLAQSMYEKGYRKFEIVPE